MLHVRQTWNYQAGKGCYIGKPKTPDSQRVVKISRTSTTTDIYAHVISEAAAKAAAVSDRFADLVVDAGTKVAPQAEKDEQAGYAKSPGTVALVVVRN